MPKIPETDPKLVNPTVDQAKYATVATPATDPVRMLTSPIDAAQKKTLLSGSMATQEKGATEKRPPKVAPAQDAPPAPSMQKARSQYAASTSHARTSSGVGAVKSQKYQEYLAGMQKEIHDEKMKRFVEHT